VVVLEYAGEAHSVTTGVPYTNGFISVLTIVNRKVTRWRYLGRSESLTLSAGPPLSLLFSSLASIWSSSGAKEGKRATTVSWGGLVVAAAG
jgi:hypothetical protein